MGPIILYMDDLSIISKPVWCRGGLAEYAHEFQLGVCAFGGSVAVPDDASGQYQTRDSIEAGQYDGRLPY